MRDDMWKIYARLVVERRRAVKDPDGVRMLG